MISTIKRLFHIAPKADWAKLIHDGALIVDVRTSAEFDSGHLRGSVNIPLQQLANKLSKMDKTKPVITCCASGVRSSSARNLLLTNGFKEVYNGGSWRNLHKYIN